ncbi:MAG: DUF5652 family protein [Patescibacteria group bacterium]
MEQLLYEKFWILGIAAIWTLPWKGMALWRAAQNKDKRWFVVLLLINTLAILDILYLYIWGKKKTD